MKKLLAVAALLVLASPAAAQDSIPDAPSLREIRQRTGFALDRADNLTEEIAAAIAHLERLRAMADSAVARDSALALLPDSGALDTVRVTETDTVRDTVRVSGYDLRPGWPSRPTLYRTGTDSIRAVWPKVKRATYYKVNSAAGYHTVYDTTLTAPLEHGDWICLWAHNGVGATPPGRGTCMTVDTAQVALGPDMLPAPEVLGIDETSRTDSTITYRVTWSCVQGAEWYALEAGSESGRWSWTDSVAAPATCDETVEATLVMAGGVPQGLVMRE